MSAALGTGWPEHAKAALRAWIVACPEQRPLLEAVWAAGLGEALLAGFAGRVAFGTGGVRGPVGLGPACVNAGTVRALAAAHASLLAPGDLVVLGGDTRCFHDLSGRYGGLVPAISSGELVEAAALVYLAAGLDVCVAPGPVPTPALGFAVRALGAVGGLCVTASHNPPDDNGAKVLDAGGAQPVSPVDLALEAAWGAAPRAGAAGQRRAWPQGLLARFDAAVAGLSAAGPRARVAVSVLHGAARLVQGLQAAGHEVVAVAEQAVLDGRFASLPGGSANPEAAEVYAGVIALAEREGLGLGLVADPDGDRLGVVVREAEGWQVWSGDRLALLLGEEALLRAGEAARGALLLRTCLTSDGLDAMAEAAGARVIGDLPVGFKHLVAARRAEPGRALLLAVEQSCGSLVWELGDKDAHASAVWVADAYGRAAAAGQTLGQRLSALEARWGAVRSVGLRVPGATLDEGLWGRLAGLEVLGGRRVERLVDHREPGGPLAGWPWLRAADRAMAELHLSCEAGERRVRLWVRGSGTEPLLKAYVMVSGAPGGELRALEFTASGLGQALREWLATD